MSTARSMTPCSAPRQVRPGAKHGPTTPPVIQRKFGGKPTAAAPKTATPAAGAPPGPSLDPPITLPTRPAGKFPLPPLHQQGDYVLQNIRLVDKTTGAFVQYATPTATVVHVVGVLGTTVKITQLTPDDLRARGISIDARNYDAYDYNFIFAINGLQVEIPYPVIIDRRTHEAIRPPVVAATPPRRPPHWAPPP